MINYELAAVATVVREFGFLGFDFIRDWVCPPT
ncbi:hypothetical protein SAMN05444959_10212 [Paracoccus seriniphilus]|uniref:Uncharacterized protein n=1 Tax=Paracoccus seriniphilus TaxID=184748 RepID=A0A239PMG0_9RHOB|nr:hypothetical protein SAMN05444959_10212 [Paracoccus seriniphilus]